MGLISKKCANDISQRVNDNFKKKMIMSKDYGYKAQKSWKLLSK